MQLCRKACTRSFWKLEAPGQFARDHQKVLLVNSWDHIAQEILMSTPRRFGKTISVSMFCAAMILACPGVEIRRISQKILRNVQKFALLIAESEYGTLNLSVKREKMEEINLHGPLGNNDVCIINSYPSKVGVYYLTVPKVPNVPNVPKVPKVCNPHSLDLLHLNPQAASLRHHAELALRQRQRQRLRFRVLRHEREQVLQEQAQHGVVMRRKST
jgi:hypothetical protein